MEALLRNLQLDAKNRAIVESKYLQAWNPLKKLKKNARQTKSSIAEILVLSSYPPRECGIATYTYDLIKSMEEKFGDSYSFQICALENGISGLSYEDRVTYKLDTTSSQAYSNLIENINSNAAIKAVMIQHEFGLFGTNHEKDILNLIHYLNKPVVIVFHTIIPSPSLEKLRQLQALVSASSSVVVMTMDAASILELDYGVAKSKITIIPHGTHLVPHLNKDLLKEKYNLKGRKILSTFGLLSSGKGIETTIEALPTIIQSEPSVLFLIIGKTHPNVFKEEGEKYRNELESKVETLGIKDNVLFINSYLALDDLLEYLQLTDVYLFTSIDPRQAVSGTFAYAMSCACPIISTPIPHALEVLKDETGVIIDFRNSSQLAKETICLLMDEDLRQKTASNTLQKSILTAWENAAVAHALLFEKIGNSNHLVYSIPPIKLTHVKNMTTDFGIIQFSKINQPDISSGYTLDDNVRALIAMCLHYELTKEPEDLYYIQLYLNFIDFCTDSNGYFLNYVDEKKAFTLQNQSVNLSDSNGRAIWALGFLISKRTIIPREMVQQAERILFQVIPRVEMMHSTRAMAFALKGLCHGYGSTEEPIPMSVITMLATRLSNMYNHESEPGWEWFEGYLTYGNSLLPEAMLEAWKLTGNESYKDIALASFTFLLKNTFNEDGIQVISNRSWWQKGQKAARYGEQPIEITYTMLTLEKFFEIFEDIEYFEKLEIAFDWFLGKNHLKQVIYNPCTGGCYDGLEETRVNVNQGAESTVCYLMARLVIEKFKQKT